MTAPTRRPVLPAAAKLAERARTERRELRRRWARRAGWVLGPLLLLGMLGWLLAASPLLDVDRVSVQGAGPGNAEAVRRAAAVESGAALALVDATAVARRVKALPLVADVTVDRSWPSTLRLVVVERRPVAVVAQGRGWGLVDGSGTVFATVATRPGGLVLLTAGRPGPQDAATRAALEVLAALPPALRTPLAEVKAPTPASVELVLKDRRRVVWGAPGDTTSKAAALAALLRMPGTVFDVSAPGVVTRR